jgi:hypothetical protein
MPSTSHLLPPRERLGAARASVASTRRGRPWRRPGVDRAFCQGRRAAGRSSRRIAPTPCSPPPAKRSVPRGPRGSWTSPHRVKRSSRRRLAGRDGSRLGRDRAPGRERRDGAGDAFVLGSSSAGLRGNGPAGRSASLSVRRWQDTARRPASCRRRVQTGPDATVAAIGPQPRRAPGTLRSPMIATDRPQPRGVRCARRQPARRGARSTSSATASRTRKPRRRERFRGGGRPPGAVPATVAIR